MKIIGLNLSKTEDEKSSFCYLSEEIELITEFGSDKVIIEEVEKIKPDIIVFNSPLSLPTKGNWRAAEEEMDKRKMKFVAPRGLVVMEKLTLRGIALKEQFAAYGALVIETFAGAFFYTINFPRKNNELEIKRVLKLFDITLPRRSYSQNELDSVIAAFTGRMFLEAKVEFLGDENEGQIVLPKIM